MNIILAFGVLFIVTLQGCTQGNSSSMKDEAFKNYVNSNAQSQVTTNQQSNAIVAAKF